MSDTEQRDDTATDGVGDWAGNPYASRMVEYTPYAVALGMKFMSSSAGRGEILLPRLGIHPQPRQPAHITIFPR